MTGLTRSGDAYCVWCDGVMVWVLMQTFVASRRMAAPVQPAAAAAAALSAATAIPPPTSVQQKLEQLQARSDKRYGSRHPKHHEYPPEDDDHDDGEGQSTSSSTCSILYIHPRSGQKQRLSCFFIDPFAILLITSFDQSSRVISN